MANFKRKNRRTPQFRKRGGQGGNFVVRNVIAAYGSDGYDLRNTRQALKIMLRKEMA